MCGPCLWVGRSKNQVRQMSVPTILNFSNSWTPWKTFKRNRLAVLSLNFLVFIMTLAALAPITTNFSYEEQNIAQMQATLKKAKETQTQYAQASATFQGTPASKRDLDGEIGRMNQQVASLERNIVDYNRALAVSKA